LPFLVVQNTDRHERIDGLGIFRDHVVVLRDRSVKFFLSGVSRTDQQIGPHEIRIRLNALVQIFNRFWVLFLPEFDLSQHLIHAAFVLRLRELLFAGCSAVPALPWSKSSGTAEARISTRSGFDARMRSYSLIASEIFFEWHTQRQC